MRQVSGLRDLEFTQIMTMGLVFAVIAGIIAAVLWYSGASGVGGLWFGIGLSFMFLGIQWWLGPILVKFITGAKEVSQAEQPYLHEVIGRLASQAGVPKPKVYIVNNPSPNAFAFGRTQGSSGIAVHTGLLNMLNKDEVETVLAHEMGHIKHRDVMVMTLASALPVMLYYIVLVFGSKDDRDRGFTNMILVYVGAMIAQFLGTIMVMWLSRKREYYADAYSAYATGKPESLMSALAKITYAPQPVPVPRKQDSSMSSFYIAEPQQFTGGAKAIAEAIGRRDDASLEKAIEAEKAKGGRELLMTHPLTAKRLEALLKIKRGS